MKKFRKLTRPMMGFDTKTSETFYYYHVRREDGSWGYVIGDRGDCPEPEGGGSKRWVIFYNKEERDRDMAEMNERLKEKYGYT
jgi:hypothetical protein